ncbi:MAG: hypothetical protein IPJ76_02535 [Flavobacteriales bacterium]|nr:MAG: hypothetical protein IPJ76_02535 [Flavobacteriales bacterium]
MRLSLFVVLLAASVASMAQGLAPFNSQLDRFWVFDNGSFHELNNRKPGMVRVVGDRVVFLTEAGDLALYEAGGRTQTLERGTRPQVIAGDGMAGFKVANTLKVIGTNGAKSIAYNVADFSVQDSLIAFHDNAQHVLGIYWKNQVVTVADVMADSDRPQWLVGPNTLLFYDHERRTIYLTYRGETTELCRTSDFASVSAGTDIVAYVNGDDRTFHVYDKGQDNTVADFPPRNFKAGDGVVAFTDVNGALRAYSGGMVYDVSDFAPEQYWVQDSLLLFVEQGLLKVFAGGKLEVVERYVPEKWQVFGGWLVYLDLNRTLRSWSPRGRVQLSKEASIASFELYRDAVVWRSNMGAVKVWWNGKVHEHY